MAKIKKLTREQIVHVAMEMFDSEGDAGFSMRKLAGKLGVDPMAIYHHHANRNALISEVVQAYLSQRRIPTRSGDWRVDIRELCQSLRGLAKSHPNIFRLYQAHDTYHLVGCRLRKPNGGARCPLAVELYRVVCCG